MDFRKEYSNPQFERESWMNLNGVWRFAFDFGKSGMERKMYLSNEDTLKCYDKSINVPFCPESKLSGIEYKDFISAVWYQRDVILTERQLMGRTFIHFGAVDYETRVFVNAVEVGKHIGGYSSFVFEITDYVMEGENTITVYDIDDVRNGGQARGKQAESYYSAGCDYTRTTGIWQTVWLEAVGRDFNHPSIIGWCPFNETWDYAGKVQNELILENIYRLTKALDTTRPCIDTSGNFHVVTDIYDLHNYRQDVKEFSDCYKDFPKDTETMEEHPTRQHYKKGLPLFISEYGGIKWGTSLENQDAWGYGEEPKTEEEFIDRYRGLTESLLKHPYIMGFCYTQLYDIEQETNGLYDYDRKPKFDGKEIYKINSAKAAIEDD